MNEWTIIWVSFIVLIFMIIIGKYSYDNIKLQNDYTDLKKQHIRLKNIYQDLQKNYKSCLDIKFADENILYYVRCINDPRKEVCKSSTSNSNICRSRLEECNKMRGIIENDPVAVYRMQMLNQGI